MSAGMSNVVSLDDYRKKEEVPAAGDAVTILLGEQCGSICPHCGDVLYHAMVMPHANKGKACRSCDIWFDGIDDLYR